MLNRRKFLQQSAFGAGSMLAATMLPQTLLAADSNKAKLTILHTNDVHSRLDPFPMDGSRNAGLGGVAARAELIKKIRSEEEHVLLLDAGDIFQGTPYFNLYKGEPEIKAMTMMGYDAATMGNHDFDAGLENFANQLQHAQFPILMSNYDFTHTAMESKYVPYKIFKKGPLKIGVTGVGIEMKGLVPDNLFGETKYLDPIKKASATAEYLKKNEKCDLVICLSHLGYKYSDNKVSDQVLAKESEFVDIIIGGHTHTFMDKPETITNKKGADVLINQVGWAGIVLGRIDIEFSKGKKKNLSESNTVVNGKKTSE
ncbi:MAG: metallophosphatase [Sphingobacteriales bacterium]|nr:metallophosphatase [Sphingobacteriales bacterium]MBI3717485.1 metallophosphatase [Sphingobacteriales bacterium]